MSHLIKSTFIATALLLVVTAAATQDAGKAQRLTVPITDPGRPISVHASIFTGGLELEAYEGKEVLIEVVPQEQPEAPRTEGGMKVIPNRSLGITVEELDNTVSIRSDFTGKIEKLVVRLPRRASLKASTVQGGDIVVRGIEGELELQNTAGSITATDIAGSVVAQTTSGGIKVSFTSIQPGKSMSFVTFDGDVDVTFPGGLKADLRVSAGQGDIYTDFDFDMVPAERSVQKGRTDGKFKVELSQEVRARIGSGGPEMHFKTWNGNIFIRRSGR
jgi:hypothetical protein